MFPVVVYFRINDLLKHRCLVIISDCITYDAVAVNVYCKIILEHLNSLSTAKNMYYFSDDGAPQEFKNVENFVNSYNHIEDFGVPAEWQFFATAHGKGL